MRHLEVYDLSFQNLSERSMTFEQVYQRIERFMQKEPRGNYRLMVGTDSQVHSRSTRFITGVAIQRKGKGVWACYRKTVVPRRMDILHPRISYETSLTEEVVSLFTEERKNNLINIILPYIYHGSSFSIEGHIDIGDGPRNKTREFVNEMVSRMESMGVEPKIKPEAIIASGYANHFTR